MNINMRSPKVLAACIVAFTLMVLGVARLYDVLPISQVSPELIAKFREDAEQGDYETGGKLAWMYEYGTRGVKQDYKEAYFLFSLSYVQVEQSEIVTLRERVAEVKKHLTPEERAEVDQRILGWVKSHPTLVVRQPELPSESNGPD